MAVNIKQPVIAPKVDNDGIVICWTYDNGYAELDFDKKTGKVGWFCMDRTNKDNKSIGSDEDIDYIPAEFFEFLFKMFPAKNE